MAAPILRIDARTYAPLRDLITVLKRADKDIAKSIRGQSKRVIEPEWKKGLAERASTKMQQRTIVGTARVAVSDQNVTLRSGATKGGFKGGFDPRNPNHFYAVESGSNREQFTTYKRRAKKGGTFEVKRRTRRQFLLPRARGYVAGPTAQNLIPRVFRLWAQTAVRELAESIEEVS
ncbi:MULTISPECIES: hypothetical protein [Microbacterium]|uniref:HK97 gp10 family phage protein n=1 Tax=Microbacterium oxydans TaxID=82380 RepID=A0A3S9WIV4_9MICO|nr:MULTISPECIES: hypothetical protein [Microbacterium]AZS39981.1 hypothetical protein CVS54_01299 [Microbacterium oxydans]KKX97189.1 hypothetical protein AAY78_14525 [Microbacterium sp. Ag1]